MPLYNVNTTELRTLADELIKSEPDLAKVAMLKLDFLFRPEATLSAGRLIHGMCIRCDDRQWALHKTDFIIEIAKDVWDAAPDEYHRALMHHELSHIGFHIDKESGNPAIADSGRVRTFSAPHEIEEFEIILTRYGPQHQALRRFVANFQAQLLAVKTAKPKEETKPAPAAKAPETQPEMEEVSL
jgi:hypothetical protein